MADEYYWCLKHDRVESEDRCGAAWIRGPYDSPEAARQFAERAEQRNEAWDEADEDWESWGDDPGGEDPGGDDDS